MRWKPIALEIMPRTTGTHSAHGRVNRLTGQGSAPSFCVGPDPIYRSRWAALKALLASTPWPPPLSTRFSRSVHVPPGRLPKRAVFASTLLQFSVALFLILVPFPTSWLAQESRPAVIYDLEPFNISAYLPRIQPKPRKKRAERKVKPPEEKPVQRASKAIQSPLSIVSKPERPDNARQLVVQSNTNLDLRSPIAVQLPNLISVKRAPNLKRRTDSLFSGRTRGRETAETKIARPRSLDQTNRTQAERNSALSANSMAQLPVPVAPAPAPTETLNSDISTGLKTGLGNGDGGSDDKLSLIALSADAAPPQQTITLPPGNRLGEFALSPDGTETDPAKTASEGGPEGDPEAESTGTEDGDESGTGETGGEGEEIVAGVMLSVSGGEETLEAKEGPYLLDPAPPAPMVYPVPIKARPRGGALIISSGPTGGGGLSIYKILRGGNVHTVYLSMPGQNWILQYSRAKTPAKRRSRRSRNIVIQLGAMMEPPNPVEQFDFHREPPPPGKERSMIVLHGWIRNDGSVKNLRVVQSTTDAVGRAAIAAFNRWKFMPALRGEDPVEVEILVGIPAKPPGGQVGAPRAADNP